jgi:hypothetical protein
VSKQERAEKVLDLSRRIKQLGDTPAEYGSEHRAAQSEMASLGYELASTILDGNSDS